MKKHIVLTATIFIVIFALFLVDFLLSEECPDGCELGWRPMTDWCEEKCDGEQCIWDSCEILYEGECDENMGECIWFVHCLCQDPPPTTAAGSVRTACPECMPVR